MFLQLVSAHERERAKHASQISKSSARRVVLTALEELAAGGEGFPFVGDFLRHWKATADTKSRKSEASKAAHYRKWSQRFH